MNIGSAAARSGLPPKTIRYYEEIGLIPTAGRTDGGYRDYDETDVQILRFLRRARGLGFSVAECRELLSLYRDRDRASADVKAIALQRIDDIERKILELESMRATLTHLAHACHGDERPDCPILEDLAAGKEKA